MLQEVRSHIKNQDVKAQFGDLTCAGLCHPRSPVGRDWRQRELLLGISRLSIRCYFRKTLCTNAIYVTLSLYISAH